jgi:hypothetical protein
MREFHTSEINNNNVYEGDQAMRKSDATQLKRQETETFDTPTDLSRNAVAGISSSLRHLLADVFALYEKTKNLRRRAAGQ